MPELHVDMKRKNRARLCQSCGHQTGRYAQDASGLCRRCHHVETGYVGCVSREAARVERGRLKLAGVARRIPKPEGPRRIVIADGKEFEVLWDGT